MEEQKQFLIKTKDRKLYELIEKIRALVCTMKRKSTLRVEELAKEVTNNLQR